jgi:DNA polymerase phi
LESTGDDESSARVEDDESNEAKDEKTHSNITDNAMVETTDEESERDLDDDQMMAMDDQLALIFKDRAKKRKGKGMLSRLVQAAGVNKYVS